MKNNPDRKLFRPFGPSVGKTEIPNNIVNKINTYIDELIKEEAKIKKQDVGKNLAGNVSQEFELERKFAEECGWLQFLSKECALWIQESTGKKISKFELIGTWVVRQFENEYNPLHFHAGHISGVGYLKIPENFGEITHKQKPSTHGNINFVHGSKQFLFFRN